MPSNPTVNDVHTNGPLTNIAIAYSQDPANFFASRVFPIVPVKHKSDRFYVWDRADWNRDSAAQVAAGDEYPIGVKRLSSQPYSCDVYKYSEMIADEERDNSDSVLDLDMTSAENVMRKHLIRMDRKFTENFFTTGVWTGSVSGSDVAPGAKWDDKSSGDPLEDLRPEIRSLTKKGLSRRNIKLLVGPTVWDAIRDHPVFLDRYENVREALLSEADIAKVLGIGEVVVGESVYNSANEGATAVDNFILGDEGALLVYAAPSPQLNKPSGGYIFSWAGLTGSNNKGIQIEKLRRGSRDADQIKGRCAFDANVVAGECGVYFSDVMT